MYTLFDHIHNFACWTAARASQRRFKKSAEIAKAINDSNIKEIATYKSKRPNDDAGFDMWHEQTSEQILKSLDANPETDYGRAAKIIAI